MPTYEYVCKACGHRFDVWQSMNDDALTICPECGGDLRKVFAPPAITFKGSGFYATDHGKKAETGEGTASKKEAASTSKGPKGAEGSSDTGAGSGSAGKDGGGSSGPGSASGSKDGGSSGSSTSTSSKGSST